VRKIIKNILLMVGCYFSLFVRRVWIAKLSNIRPLVETDFDKQSNLCVVIGNGPSLKNDINKILQIADADFFCVNHMADYDFFQELKPSKYALFDSYFWAQGAEKTLKKKREILFENLNEKVTWPMLIYIPREADLDFFRREITNPKIKIHKLSLISISTPMRYRKISSILLEGKYGPPACNVVIYSMYLSIMAGYQYIELYGADLSFTEDVIVDQKTNQLLIEYKHFYGESTFEPLLKNPQRNSPFTMESLYEITYLTFYAHNLLNQMALIKGVKIINKSSYSLIDSYERK